MFVSKLQFAVLLFVIAICEVDVATECFLRSDDIDSGNREVMVDSFAKYTSNDEVFHSFNNMQYDVSIKYEQLR